MTLTEQKRFKVWRDFMTHDDLGNKKPLGDKIAAPRVKSVDFVRGNDDRISSATVTETIQ